MCVFHRRDAPTNTACLACDSSIYSRIYFCMAVFREVKMQSNPTTIIVDDAGVEALCQSCGVCCSTFRISFYWGETTAAEGGVVPVEMTEQMNLYRSCMKGSSQTKPRCIALKGNLGESVCCSIYENRPSPCREYQVFDELGNLNPRCNQAREKHGLLPLNVRFVPVVGIPSDITLPTPVPTSTTLQA
jgi:uncharacterized protein